MATPNVDIQRQIVTLVHELTPKQVLNKTRTNPKANISLSGKTEEINSKRTEHKAKARVADGRGSGTKQEKDCKRKQQK